MSENLPAAYPLNWPEGWKRTASYERKSSAYQVEFVKARDEVAHSLSLMGVPRGQSVVSSNIPLRRDGLPYAGTAQPSDPGIAVWWTERSGLVRVIACDMWRTTRENMRAVGYGLEAVRTLQRCGATQILERTMQSFTAAALPSSKPAWFYVLGLRDWPPTEALIQAAYKARAKEAHPDTGGSHELFLELQAALESALTWLRGGGGRG